MKMEFDLNDMTSNYIMEMNSCA